MADEHGPFCAYCGACKECWLAGLLNDSWCWDDPRAEPRRGRHKWNVAKADLPPADPPTAEQASYARSWGTDV